MAKEHPTENLRECGMMTDVGLQGVGKTYQKMHTIKEYISDNFQTKVKGRKCLLLDTNGEYTKEQFAKNGIENFAPRLIAIKDIEAWCKSDVIECRRIDAKSLAIKDKKKVLEYLLKVCRNCMVVVEDINNFVLNITHIEEIVGGLINLRHKGVDVSLSFQALRPIEPRIFQNSRWLSLFFQTDQIEDVLGKLPNPTLYKLAQLLVNNRYHNGDKRFFVYIHNFTNEIEGDFTKQEFMTVCEQYLNLNKRIIKEYEEIHDCSREKSIEEQSKRFFEMYYGNANK
jgi:hypothetical protein